MHENLRKSLPASAARPPDAQPDRDPVAATDRFGALHREGKLRVATEDHYADMFQAAERAFAGQGLAHYEVSNYAVPGEESRHNLHYWRGGDYLGLGAAAVGCLLTRPGHAQRWRNMPDGHAFVRREAENSGRREAEVEDLDGATLLRESLMLGLRTAEGVDVAFAEARAAGMRLARVAAQHRGGHVLLSSAGQFGGDHETDAVVELRADLAGRLRRAIAEDSAAGPAVGDWVATTVAGERPSATIHAVLPRRTKLSRKAAGRGASEQLVAANVDRVFLVCPLDQPLVALDGRPAGAIMEIARAALLHRMTINHTPAHGRCQTCWIVRSKLWPIAITASMPAMVIGSPCGSCPSSAA